MDEIISYTIELKSSDLSCCICFDKLNIPFAQCANAGAHFVCVGCFRKIGNKCPQCKNNSLFNNKQLVSQLLKFMENCPNKHCKVKTLRWNLSDHQDECIYTRTKCPICNKMVSLSAIQSHFERKCTTKVIKKDYQFNSNSYDIEVDALENNTSLIIDDGVLLFRKEETKWFLCPLALSSTSVIIVTTTKRSPDDTISVRSVHLKCQTNLNKLKWKDLDTDGDVKVQMIENGQDGITGFLNHVFNVRNNQSEDFDN